MTAAPLQVGTTGLIIQHPIQRDSFRLACTQSLTTVAVGYQLRDRLHIGAGRTGAKRQRQDAAAVGCYRAFDHTVHGERCTASESTKRAAVAVVIKRTGAATAGNGQCGTAPITAPAGQRRQINIAQAYSRSQHHCRTIFGISGIRRTRQAGQGRRVINRINGDRY